MRMRMMMMIRNIKSSLRRSDLGTDASYTCRYISRSTNAARFHWCLLTLFTSHIGDQIHDVLWIEFICIVRPKNVCCFCMSCWTSEREREWKFWLVDLFAQLASTVDEIGWEQVVDRREGRKRAKAANNASRWMVDDSSNFTSSSSSKSNLSKASVCWLLSNGI